MLLNEFPKHIQMDAQQKQIEALAEGLQEMRAQLKVSKSAPHTVLNASTAIELLSLFKSGFVLMRFNYVASHVINPNRRIMRAAVELRVCLPRELPDIIADRRGAPR